MKIQLLFLLIFAIGCKTTVLKNVRSKFQINNDRRFSKEDSLFILQDTLINKLLNSTDDEIISCKNYPFQLILDKETKTFKGSYLTHVIRCLNEEAFKGDLRSESLLVLYHLTLPAESRPIYRKVRGQRMFNLFLRPLGNFETNKGGGPDKGRIYYDILRPRVFEMIKTIDGMNPGEFPFKYYNEIKGIPDNKSLQLMIDNNPQYYKMEYESLVYAFKNKLIEFKNYGEL